MFGVPLWAIGAAVAVALVAGAYWQGTRAGRAACELRVERAVAAEQARQRAVGTRALEADAEAAARDRKDADAAADAAAKVEAAAEAAGTCVDRVTEELRDALEGVR